MSNAVCLYISTIVYIISISCSNFGTRPEAKRFRTTGLIIGGCAKEFSRDRDMALMAGDSQHTALFVIL